MNADDPMMGAERGWGDNHLPLGVAQFSDGAHLVTRLGNWAFRLGDLQRSGVIEGPRNWHGAFAAANVNGFLALGPEAHAVIREQLQGACKTWPAEMQRAALPVAGLTMRCPIAPRDYVDFYASEAHAARCSRLPGQSAVLPDTWYEIPLGYHGRVGSIIGDGQSIARPVGFVETAEGRAMAASSKLDYELEVGFVFRAATAPNQRLAVSDFDDAVFGLFLLNDWSARDVQKLESRPLGPFHAKAFATQVASWVTPLAALEDHRATATPEDRRQVTHLRNGLSASYDLSLFAELETGDGKESCPLASSKLSDLYWTPAQMMAHLSSIGAPIAAGDVFATGTVSGPKPEQTGCLLERHVEQRMPLPIGEGRNWLEDGDRVTLSGWAGDLAGEGAVRLGSVSGAIRPAVPLR